jgi:DNA modification methylase
MINQVIQGDCLDVMKGIADKSIDMILCDLPYG